ncbi:MAG: DNA-directed RNA polymerase subunit H [Candidatus Marsarchaeota archaeon]|nr:DNA-directed RNA polymerase subunit H [Candidatus Marsarchaeota archaeon]
MVAPRELIPEHRLLSASEAKKVAQQFETTPDKFPKILESDPQSVKIGAKSGQLIAIDRKDPTGSYTYYRYVIKG